MIVRENIDCYRYEIHSLVKAFYPEENVRVIVLGDPHAEKALREEPFVFMEIFFEERILSVYLYRQTKGGGREVSTVRMMRVRMGLEKSAETKDALKTLLYDTLATCTGRELPWGDLIGIRPTKLAMKRLEEGMSAPEICRYLQTEHRVSGRKAQLAVEIAAREQRILSKIHYENGYSLYIGIPFCPSTCLYCSFTSYSIAAWKGRVDEYLAALDRELRETAQLMKGLTLDTVYIGGGTPTSLEADQLDRLCQAVESYFDLGTAQEFTVEAGRPDSITEEKLRVLRAHPVTRISVNPQTMNEDTLRIIGRGHSARQVEDAFYLARSCGFDNINMDIILGLPGENGENVRHTTECIEKLSPESLTVHSLAVKRGSRLKRVIDENGGPAFRNTEEIMRIAEQAAARMGMEPYYLYRQKNMSGNFENVGYARPGCSGIYNILIMEEKQSIMAVGAGSISKRVFRQPDGSLRIERCEDAKDLDTYLGHFDEMLRRKRLLFPQEGAHHL